MLGGLVVLGTVVFVGDEETNGRAWAKRVSEGGRTIWKGHEQCTLYDGNTMTRLSCSSQGSLCYNHVRKQHPGGYQPSQNRIPSMA